VGREELKGRRAGQATFIVHVQYRQNATWQGQVTWAEKEKIQSFRSALELIKLMDSALDSQSKTGEENAEDIGGDHEA
jgi:hypothetical protein